MKNFILFLGLMGCTLACTNFLVTKGASKDNTNMISYAADSHVLYGELYHRPAADHKEGEMIDIVEWDTGMPLGKIPQVPHTYNVIGNMNEYQVAIGETTFVGREELIPKKGVIDYGNLIWLTLQRSKSAREAIKVMTDLVATYGYHSEGESFSIMDKNEVWILEMIGKGDQFGAVWAAMRIPDGAISAHANQARITQLKFNDPENCVFSDDVISFAREKGYFDGPDEEFSFSDTYHPVVPSTTRGCDMRAYAFFHHMLGEETMAQYYQYALGNIEYGAHGYATNRMPLYFTVPESKKISVRQVMKAMRDHFEELTISMADVPGAGPYVAPYRWRPMGFKVNGKEYTHERAVATQQTAWSFVAQSNPSAVADVIGGIFWFGVDDTAQSVYTPFFCGHNDVNEHFRVGNGDLITYSPTSMFWVTSRVASQAYLRYNEAIVDINKAQDELEEYFIREVKRVAEIAENIYLADGKKATVSYLTYTSNQFADKTFKRYQELETFLLIKYIDGNTKREENGVFLRDEYGNVATPANPGYPQWYYDDIVAATGDLHALPPDPAQARQCRRMRMKGI